MSSQTSARCGDAALTRRSTQDGEKLSEEIVADVIGEIVVGQARQITSIPAAIFHVVIREDLIVGDTRGQRIVTDTGGDDALVVRKEKSRVMHGAKEVDTQPHVAAQTRPARFE